MISLRIGYGTDVHPLVSGESLVLGGETVESDRGTEGHSDGDVLVHALVDALLGAAGWGDIGQHFPSGDDRWEDVPSITFLRQVGDWLEEEDLIVVNADLTVHLEDIRLGSYRGAMRTNCENPLPVEGGINLKFTTADGLGPIGRGEAIRAEGVCLLDACS